MMKSETKDRLIKSLSELAIEGLKKLAADGKKLTPESLYEIVSTMPETDGLLEAVVPEGSKERETLADENETLKAQKRKLIRQLDDLEDASSSVETVYDRMLLFFLDSVRSDSDSPLNKKVKKFKDLIKKKPHIDIVDKAFSDLKTSVLHGEVSDEGKEDKKQKSLVSRFMKKDSAADVEIRYIGQFKVAYQEIIDELGLDLGVDYLPKLLHLGKRITTSNSIDDFDSLRKDILALLRDYVTSVSLEREQAAEFIKEIGRKLVEVENELSKTFGFTDEIFVSNSDFTDVLEEELNDLKNTLSFSNRIEELKEAVNSKINVIQTAVRKKSESDQTMKLEVDSDVEQLKNEFEKLKAEAILAREQADLLEHEIYTDPLTGSMNRRAYDKRIKEEFDRYLRYKRVFSILLFDVDHFKQINDTYGHATGDTCLKEIIKRIKPMLRESDLLARYGGEEFVAILPETGITAAGSVAEKLRAAIEKIEFIHRDEVVRVTISIGVTEVLSTDVSPADCFTRMDMAMYEAKNSGRNKVVSKEA